MFLEMVKDMPRGRAESLSRMLVPGLVVMTLALGVVGWRMVEDGRETADLEQQVEQQARDAGVLIMDPRSTVPSDGVRDVTLLVDGRPVEGAVRVEDGEATLLVVSGDGRLVPVGR